MIEHEDPQLCDGDMIVRRVVNGWILIQVRTPDEGGPRGYIEAVFSDHPPRNTNRPNERAESFQELLWEGFEDVFRSKHEGGLEVSYTPKGRSEGDDEDEL